MVEHVKYFGYRRSIPTIASKKFILICFLSICAITQALAQSNHLVYEYCQNERGNFTTNSTYRVNLHQVLSTISSSEGNGHGFYSWSSSFYGQLDQVHVAGLCRGDIEPEICRKCLNQSTHLLTQVCPNQKKAIGGFDECMLRYTNRSSPRAMLTHPRFNLWTQTSFSLNNIYAFSQQLRAFLNHLKNEASLGGLQVKFAIGNSTILGFQTIHAFVQCTPDLSREECENCLEGAFADIPTDKAWIGGRVIAPSCNFRYDTHYFFNRTSFEEYLPTSRIQSVVVVRSSQSSRNTGSTNGKKSNKSRNMIIIISTVVPSVVLLGLIISIGVYTRVRKSSSDKKKLVADLLPPEDAEEIGCAKCLQFDFNAIRDATDNFAERNKIGSGGFGDVYRGTLHDGQRIAVKRINGINSNSRDVVKNEIQFGSKVRHRNLVRLLGFCLKQDSRFLIYEFLPMKLDHVLFETTSQMTQYYLDWDKRYKIIKGIARGLLYLHEDYHSTIIHRDIKASNILLDEEMNPKISGSELARLLRVDEHQSEVTEVVMGTFGYIDPEYLRRGRFSIKSDVYSFGVLLIELVSGQKTISFGGENREAYPLFAWRNWSQGTSSNLIDPKIRDNITESEHEMITKCIQIGLLCVQSEWDDRPTMNSVVHMLYCDSIMLPIPLNPNGISRSDTSFNIENSDGEIHSDTVSNIALSESTSQELGHLDDQLSTYGASTTAESPRSIN